MERSTSSTAVDEKPSSPSIQLKVVDLSELTEGLTILPSPCGDRDPNVPHAPSRPLVLTEREERLALVNALRYFPPEWHAELAAEFAHELRAYGHIYMYRFRPRRVALRAYPLSCYPARTQHAAAIMLMICNNLDAAVAQYPHELVTYGGNGSVFQHWGQFRLVMRYLSQLDHAQTLVIYSGHPLGVFPSHEESPRVVLTNGMMVPNHSSSLNYDRLYALGCTQYGQMTAGSYCYIGPQGIVHGTTLTLLNANRLYLDSEAASTDRPLAGRVFVSSGLGGMSGAQAKAAVICGAVAVVAEVNHDAIKKRHEQGWVMEVIADPDLLVARVKAARAGGEAVSIAYHGNIVTLWELFASIDEYIVDLGSDQTSCHNPFLGGYYPVQLTFEESNKMMREDPPRFKELVQESLRRQISAINDLSSRPRPLKFWDYGNSFLLEASRAGADVTLKGGRTGEFRYPSYVQHIMGDIFSLGFGPFRWVCTSGDPNDLDTTDRIAREVIEKLLAEAPLRVRQQYIDNLMWITQAKANRLVVGSQARILYSDALGRTQIALAFNESVRTGGLKAPVVISRDHHDVSGTDSPYRETSNITDGSSITADMAVHNFVGTALRGATYVALHNGGGTGWGEAINGGFGLVLDGSENAAKRAESLLFFDVNNGIARRAWGRNENAEFAIKRAMEGNDRLHVTLPQHADEALVEAALRAVPGRT